MLFGRSLFGGAHYPRQVTAGGSCTATGQGVADEVGSFKAAGGSFSTASIATGTGIRNVLPVPVVGRGVAEAQVAEIVHFSLAVDMGTTATVEGTGRAFFNLGAEPVATAAASGKIIRTTRMSRGSFATGVAVGEAEAFVYVYVRGEAAWGYARPFGTYFYVGWGSAAAGAAGEAHAVRARAADGLSTAECAASGSAQVASNGVVLPAEAQALLGSDPELVIKGVTHVFGRGEAVGEALPHAEEYIYTVMLAVGRVTAAGDAQALRASRGRVQAASSATGSMERVLPFEGSVTVGADALGGARARLAAFGGARVKPVAVTGAGSSSLDAKGQARTDSSAMASLLRLAIETRPGGAAGFATAGSVSPHRAAFESGTVDPQAGGSARPLVRYSLDGGAHGLGHPAGDMVLHPKIPISGEATAVAELSGINIVGVADQTLNTRVVAVAAGSRRLALGPSQRLIAVGGTARQLAA